MNLRLDDMPGPAELPVDAVAILVWEQDPAARWRLFAVASGLAVGEDPLRAAAQAHRELSGAVVVAVPLAGRDGQCPWCAGEVADVGHAPVTIARQEHVEVDLLPVLASDAPAGAPETLVDGGPAVDPGAPLPPGP